MNALYHLMSMRTLTANHIRVLVYTHNTLRTVQYALRHLFELNLVSFHEYNQGLGRLERLYFLTPKGWEYFLSLQSMQLSYKRNYQEPFTNTYFDHRCKLLDFWVVLLMEARKYSSNYNLVLFIPEWDKFEEQSIVLRYASVNGETFTIKPDASFILKNLISGQESLFFVEIDTGSESVLSRDYPSISERLFRYNQAFRQGVFRQINTFSRFTGARLLFITSSQQRIDNIIGKTRIEGVLNDAFLFSTHDVIWRKGVINGRYRKIGFEGDVGINSKPVN